MVHVLAPRLSSVPSGGVWHGAQGVVRARMEGQERLAPSADDLHDALVLDVVQHPH